MDKDIQLTVMSRKQTKNPYLFSPNERLILEAIQKHNTPLALSTTTKIPRPTVYTTLEKLEVRNLVHNIKVGKKRKWFLNTGTNVDELINKNIGKTINSTNNKKDLPTPGVQIYTEKKRYL